MPALDYSDFKKLFNADERELRSFCGDIIEKLDFRYELIKGKELEELILKILKRIDDAEMPSSGAHRYQDWVSGWQENLDEFTKTGGNAESLIPKYYFKNTPIRCLSSYIQPTSPRFIYDLTDVFRRWIFKKYLPQFHSICEFGCGTGHHLFHLASIFPDKKYMGFDWAESSQAIIRKISEFHKFKISGYKFDFFDASLPVKLDPGTAVFTFGALEQLGPGYDKFLKMLSLQKPALCINIEGINEFYDQNTLTGYLAYKYHRRRGYLFEYYSTLKKLEAEGRIEIIESYYQNAGNLYDDPHSYIIWKFK